MRALLLRLAELSKLHAVAICCALAVGAIVLAPQIVFMVAEGERYQGLYMLKTEAELHILAILNEYVDEGRVSIGNPFLFEPKHYGPEFFTTLAHVFLALPARVFDISVPTLNLVYKFVFPAVTFLLVYALVFQLTESRPWSIAAGFGILLGNVLFYGDELAHTLRLDLSYQQFVFNRPFSPQFTMPFFFLYALILFYAYKRESWPWFIALCGMFGLSFHTYFYSWSYLFALNGVFIVLWFMVGERRLAGRLSLAAAGGILIGAPELWALFSLTQHPDYAVVREHNWLASSRAPELSKLGILVSALLAWTLWQLRRGGAAAFDKIRTVFLSGILVTSFAVVNQQILTGMTLQSGHYHWIYNVPVYIVTLLITAFLWVAYIDRSRAWLRFLARFAPVALSVIFVLTGIYLQYSSYRYWAPVVDKEQRYMPALRWIGEETMTDTVIMTNDALGDLVPVFTGANLLWKHDGNHILCCYLTPPERRAFTTHAVLHSPDPLGMIASSSYRVDYVLWDRVADPEWGIDRWGIPKVFSMEDIEIYKITRPVVGTSASAIDP